MILNYGIYLVINNYLLIYKNNKKLLQGEALSTEEESSEDFAIANQGALGEIAGDRKMKFALV